MVSRSPHIFQRTLPFENRESPILTQHKFTSFLVNGKSVTQKLEDNNYFWDQWGPDGTCRDQYTKGPIGTDMFGSSSELERLKGFYESRPAK